MEKRTHFIRATVFLVSLLMLSIFYVIGSGCVEPTVSISQNMPYDELGENNNGLISNIMKQGKLENIQLTIDDIASFEAAYARY